jgi:hypothetical protein
MFQVGGAGGAYTPLQILADQKVPPGSGTGAPHYYLPPPRFLDLATFLKSRKAYCSYNSKKTPDFQK